MIQARASIIHVQHGTEFLNENLPGWYQRINLDSLGILDEKKCILGQLFGSYGEGRDALGLNLSDAIAYGFSFMAQSDTVEKRNQEWRKSIREILNKDQEGGRVTQREIPRMALKN